MRYDRVSKQRYGCQCLGYLTCAHILMHASAHEGSTDIERKSALKVDHGIKKKIKSLAAAGNRTRLSGVPIRRSINWARTCPSCRQVCNREQQRARLFDSNKTFKLSHSARSLMMRDISCNHITFMGMLDSDTSCNHITFI